MIDKFYVFLGALLLLLLIFWGHTCYHTYQEQKFLKNNCIETELYNIKGENIYDCEGVSIVGE